MLGLPHHSLLKGAAIESLTLANVRHLSTIVLFQMFEADYRLFSFSADETIITQN